MLKAYSVSVTLLDFEDTMDGFCGNVPYSIVERKNNDKNPVCNCKLKHAMEEIMKVQSWRIELM